jgi:hypothetical protein
MAWRTCLFVVRGARSFGWMSDKGTVRLTEVDVAFVLTLLRNANSPLTTAKIVAALKQRSAR